jgi:tetratricopeptide (TPR) repeat protein
MRAIMFSLQAYRGIARYRQRRGLVTTTALFIAVIFNVGSAVAQTRDKNWAQCPDASPDSSIGGCTALIESGQETTQDLAEAFINRGHAYDRMGEQARAIQDFDQAIKLKPDDAQAFYIRGTAYEYKGEHARAIQVYEQAIKLKPDYADAWANRCVSRAMIGELQAALTDCNESLRLSNGKRALASRALVYLKLKNAGAAIADCDAALAIDPKMAVSLYSRALAKRLKGDPAASDADIAAANKIDPAIGETFVMLGLALPSN